MAIKKAGYRKNLHPALLFCVLSILDYIYTLNDLFCDTNRHTVAVVVSKWLYTRTL